MSQENALQIKFSNDVEKYKIEVSKLGQNNPLFPIVTKRGEFQHITYGLFSSLPWVQLLSTLILQHNFSLPGV